MEKKELLCLDDLTVPCWISAPDYGDIRRVVLGVHGICGSAMDDIQTGIAEEMEMFGSATVRFDFPAHGENLMTDAAFSLENCRKTLLLAARYAKAQFPDVEDLCIFSSGFGAYVTLISLEELLELPGKIKLVVQTPSVLMHNTLLAMHKINRETLWAMDKITYRTKRPLTVTYRFYEELTENIAMTGYPIPMLILCGDQDKYIRLEDIQQFHRLNEASKLVIIPGAGHRFLEDGAWDMVLDLTRDWFEFEQVLLSDWF